MGTNASKRQAWVDHVAAWSTSEQTQRVYGVAQGLRYHAFDYWRRFVLRQDAPLTPPQRFSGTVLSLDVENVPSAVVDYDRTPLSRDYAYRFIGSRGPCADPHRRHHPIPAQTTKGYVAAINGDLGYALFNKRSKT